MIPSSTLPWLISLHQRLVVGVGVAGAVGLDRLEPLLGRRGALGVRDRGHDRLEVGLGRRQAELALPLGLGQVEHRGGHLVGLQLVGVVGDDRDAGRDADPVAGRRAVLAGDRGEGGRRERRQQALLLQGHQRRRVLRVEDVGRGVRTLLHDLLGQRVLVLAADLDGDAGLGLEGGGQRLGRLLVLAAVERDGAAVAAARPGRAGGARAAARRGQAGQHERRAHRHDPSRLHRRFPLDPPGGPASAGWLREYGRYT